MKLPEITVRGFKIEPRKVSGISGFKLAPKFPLKELTQGYLVLSCSIDQTASTLMSFPSTWTR